MISCLDTHILIWGIKQQAAPSQRYMIDRTINFLQWMENESHRILIPAPVLAEFLMKIPVEEHPAVVRAFEKRFIVSPFDALAASKFAAIWQTNGRKYHTEVSEHAPGREEVKVDCMIVAIAVANRASVLYSEDPHVQKIADGFITVREIPQIPQQPNLI